MVRLKMPNQNPITRKGKTEKFNAKKALFKGKIMIKIILLSNF